MPDGSRSCHHAGTERVQTRGGKRHRRRQHAASGIPRSLRTAAEVERDGVLRLLPLRHEHIHGIGMGCRNRERIALRTDKEAQPAPVAHSRQGSRNEGWHSRGETPRRLLSVADKDNDTLRVIIIQRQRQGHQHTAGLRRRRTRPRHEVRFLRVAVGPEFTLLGREGQRRQLHRQLRQESVPATVRGTGKIRHRPV